MMEMVSNFLVETLRRAISIGVAAALLLAWALTGPLFYLSDLYHADLTNDERKIMNKAIGLALLAVGIALVIYGVQASDSFGSSVSRTFTGNPTNKTIWLLVGGIAGIIIGGVLTFLPRRKL